MSFKTIVLPIWTKEKTLLLYGVIKHGWEVPVKNGFSGKVMDKFKWGLPS